MSDQSSFEELYRDQKDRLLRLAVLLTSDRTLAKDLTQDAWERVWKKWPEIRGNGDGRGYLRKTLVNLVRDHFKHQEVERKYYIPPRHTYDPPNVELRLDMLAVLNEIPPGERECVAFRHFVGLSNKETAEELGIAEGTVKSQTSRALERIRKLIEPGDAE